MQKAELQWHERTMGDSLWVDIEFEILTGEGELTETRDDLVGILES